MHYSDWPLTWDNSQRPIQAEEEGSFLCSQVQKEVDVGHYSPSFGPELLPGMYGERMFFTLLTKFLQGPVTQWWFQWGIRLKVYGGYGTRIKVSLLV